MNEKQQSDSPEQIPKELPPNYDEAMATTGKKYNQIYCIAIRIMVSRFTELFIEVC